MINLLPGEQQDKLYQYRLKRLMLVLGVIGTIFLVALLALLLTLKIYLRAEVNYQASILEAKKGKSKTTKIKSIQNEFKTYNKKLTKVDRFYQEQEHPSEFLAEMNSVLPFSVRLSSLSYKKSLEENYKAQVSLSGYCPNRDVLFKLKEKMDEKKSWEGIKFPPSNWVEPTDINFNVRFKIKNENKK